MTEDFTAVCGRISGDARDGGQERLAVARAVQEAAVRVQRQLGRVRTLMHRLDPAGLNISGRRFEAVLLGYDVYVCMLVDALAETVDTLSDGADTLAGAAGIAGSRDGRSGVAESAGQRVSGPPRASVPGIDAIGELAGAARRELMRLRALIARTEVRIGPEPALIDDWSIAEQGLFGADGVLGVILGVGTARTTSLDGSRVSTPVGWWTATSDAA